jgi:hypothetical protein
MSGAVALCRSTKDKATQTGQTHCAETGTENNTVCFWKSKGKAFNKVSHMGHEFHPSTILLVAILILAEYIRCHIKEIVYHMPTFY